MYFESCQVSGFYDNQLFSGTVTAVKFIPACLDKDSDVYMRLTIKLDQRIRVGYADSGYLVLSIDDSGLPVKFLPRYTVNRVYNGRAEARYNAAVNRLTRVGLTEAATREALGRVNLDKIHHSDAVKLILDKLNKVN
jgi:hypothetical protein